MGYFYGKKGCVSLASITRANGVVVKNNDGTLSVYIPNKTGIMGAPILLNKFCCEILGNPINETYTYDNDTQECRWAAKNTETCSVDPFKIALNSNGNDGSIFYIDGSDETCSLNINFDYLIKLNCEKLSNILNGVAKTQEQLDAEDQIRTLQLLIDKKTVDCGSITTSINQLNQNINNTSYSITCTQSAYSTPQNTTVSTSSIIPFKNTGFYNTSLYAFNTYEGKVTGQVTVNYCLTTAGLSVWSSILGSRYQAFLNGDPNSYGCVQVNDIVNRHVLAVENGTPALIFECTTPFGTKSALINQLSLLEEQQTTCNNELSALNNQLTTLQTTQNESSALTKCKTPVEVLETLDISLTLDIVGADNKLTTLATYPLLEPIGAGNLYNYLIENKESGLLVCGESNTTELAYGITGCTPMYLNVEQTTVGLEDYPVKYNVYSCNQVMNSILNDLFIESGLDGTSKTNTTFKGNINPDALASKWLRYETVVTDATILAAIKNKKIKITLKINNSCSDFCVLLDNIKLNKDCTIIAENKLFITQSPGFELERLIDNKKSWIANTTPQNRFFSIFNNVAANPIRQTNYDVNDERLVINTKEIDLDISIASAIETDVWAYVVDNPCLLTGDTCTITYPIQTTDFYDNAIELPENDTEPFRGDIEDYYTCYRAFRDAERTAFKDGDMGTFLPSQIKIEDINCGRLFKIITPGDCEFIVLEKQNGCFEFYYKDYLGWVKFGDPFVIEFANGFINSHNTLLLDYDVNNEYSEYYIGPVKSCGDGTVDYSKLLSQPISDVKTIEDFEYYMTSELIDAKSRKTLSGYPTLRGVYDRYLNSSMYCSTVSSAFDYEQMDQFAKLIDSYWVDIVEQVVPATTIWGSVKIYGNTIFDEQKFTYRKSSLFTCVDSANKCSSSIENLEFVNNCIGNILDKFYFNNCGPI